MYFEMHPKMLYTLDDGDSGQVVTDIFRRVVLSEELKKNTSLYDQYDVKEFETPEIVASKFYRDPLLHWVILLTNEIIDPRFDWPLPQVNLVNYVKSKYGEANIYATHHYIDTNGYIVNSTVPGATSVSNFQYEDEINESKRRIKILKPEVVSELIGGFQDIIST